MSSSTSVDDLPSVAQSAKEPEAQSPEAPITPRSATQSTKADTDGSTPTQSVSNSRSEEGLINEMKNFDNLLRMLSVYRDNPDFRGNPNDRNIEEIAKVLSSFIGDDIDNFLSDDDEQEEDGANDKQDSTSSVNHNPLNNHDDNHKEDS